MTRVSYFGLFSKSVITMWMSHRFIDVCGSQLFPVMLGDELREIGVTPEALADWLGMPKTLRE